MKVDELIEARDMLETVAGEFSDESRTHILEVAANVLSDAIGCEDCSNRGWVVRQSTKNGMGIILKCDRCNRFIGHTDSGEDAVKVINDLLNKDGHQLEEVSS